MKFILVMVVLGCMIAPFMPAVAEIFFFIAFMASIWGLAGWLWENSDG